MAGSRWRNEKLVSFYSVSSVTVFFTCCFLFFFFSSGVTLKPYLIKPKLMKHCKASGSLSLLNPC